MASYLRSSGAEDTGVVGTFVNIQSQFTNTATNPKAGSRAFVMNYNRSGGNIICQAQWTGTPGFSNYSVKFDMRINTSLPSEDATIFSTVNTALKLTSAGKLKIASLDGSATGATVLSVNTYYRVEVRGDTNDTGKLYVRIDGTDETNCAFTTGGQSEVDFGQSNKTSPSTDPGTTITIDDIVVCVTTAGEQAPWLNAQKTQLFVVNAAGTHNDYTGTGDATNKYLNVDEKPPNTTDYNESTATNGNTQRQNHNLTDTSFLGGGEQINGFVLFGRMMTKISAGQTVGNKYLAIVEGGTEYNYAVVQDPTAAQYTTEVWGLKTSPSGAALTETILNGWDVGSKVSFVTGNSQLRETTYYVVAIYGPAFTEFGGKAKSSGYIFG